MRRFLFVFLCTLSVQCSCMAQDEVNGEITGEYYYYEGNYIPIDLGVKC